MSDPTDCVVPSYLQKHAVRFSQNLSRVDNLLSLHDFADRCIKDHARVAAALRGESSENLPEVSDVLRSATVLLHASLEDFLRTMALRHIPRTASELPEEVPLAGAGGSSGRKYTLKDLAKHCGKDVESVIQESIDEWLHQNSFNNTTDIAAILKKIGIEPNKCNGQFSQLSCMMERRHAIVHNADRSREMTVGEEKVRTIERVLVQDWRDAVERFMKDVLYQIQFVSQVDESS